MLILAILRITFFHNIFNNILKVTSYDFFREFQNMTSTLDNSPLLLD